PICLRYFREQGNDVRLAVALSNLGAIANMRKDPERAIVFIREAIALARKTRDEDGLGISLHNFSRSLLMLGRTDDGREALLESIAIARRLGYRELTACCIGVPRPGGDARRRPGTGRTAARGSRAPVSGGRGRR